MSCCDCSTTEGESELSTEQVTEQLPIAYPLQGTTNILLLYKSGHSGHPLITKRKWQTQVHTLTYIHN